MRSARHTSIGIVLTLLLTSVSTIGQSQRSSPPDEGTEVPATGTITGRVIDDTGQPVPNAAVFFRTYGSDKSGRAIATNREGTFQASGLDREVYSISARAPAYTTQPRDPDTTLAAHYRVGDSVTLVLVKGGVITGSVTTSAEEPVVGVRVRAQMIRDGQPPRYGATFGENTTDDRGVYRIYGLPPGTYLVMAGGRGGNPWELTAYDVDAPTYFPSSSPDRAIEINVRAGEETANVDIRYRGEAGHTISGIASGPQSTESSGLTLTLTSTLDGSSQWSNSSSQPPGNRSFVFSGVADGDYDITAHSYLPGGTAALSEPKRIRVKGADVTGVEITTKPLGEISGHVVMEDSKVAECKGKQRPLFTETLITAWRNENSKPKGQHQFAWYLSGPSSPRKQGNFSLRNLAPGQYQIIPRFSAKYWYLQSVSLQSTEAPGPRSTPGNRQIDAAQNWTTLKPGDRLSGLVIKLSEGAASLQGKISLGEGEQIPARLYVYLLPAEREKTNDVLRFFAAPVLSDGNIVLNNLAPGRYWIMAQPALEGPSSTLTQLRLPDETETRAKLRREAEASKTEIEFKPCQNVMDYLLPLKSFVAAPPK